MSFSELYIFFVIVVLMHISGLNCLMNNVFDVFICCVRWSISKHFGEHKPIDLLIIG